VSGAESAVEVPHVGGTMRAGACWMGMTMICRRDAVPVHRDGGVATARCRDDVPVHGGGGVATARCQLEASRGALCAAQVTGQMYCLSSVCDMVRVRTIDGLCRLLGRIAVRVGRPSRRCGERCCRWRFAAGGVHTPGFRTVSVPC
jgi:hypothetical protein